LLVGAGCSRANSAFVSWVDESLQMVQRELVVTGIIPSNLDGSGIVHLETDRRGYGAEY